MGPPEPTADAPATTAADAAAADAATAAASDADAIAKAKAAAAALATAKPGVAVPLMYPGMMMRAPGMIPGMPPRMIPKAQAGERTITPQMVRLGKIAAALGAGLMFM
jgi:hypothetical protein